MALRRFFMAPEMIQCPHPEITGSDAAHICRVLRLSDGDAVELFDGSGKAYRARIESAAPKRVVFNIEETFLLESESSLSITLALGILKDRKMDALIRQLTELGIDCWMPFYAHRSVPVAGPNRLQKRIQRWEKIALEAVKQCRRGRAPRISPAADFDAMLATCGPYDLKIMFWEGAPQAFDIPDAARRQPRTLMLLVGPEGGFDPAEVRQAQAQGFFTAGLGPRILRAETAALAACTLAQYCYGDMGQR
jgi:16S rRNA (uracil1498-N3)-methyltransferase